MAALERTGREDHGGAGETSLSLASEQKEEAVLLRTDGCSTACFQTYPTLCRRSRQIQKAKFH